MKYQSLINLVLAGSLFSIGSTYVVAEQSVAIKKINSEASDKQLLKSRLAKLEHFSAAFAQQVTDGSGTALQRTTGKLAVQKPNLVYWHTQQPEESLIVSDGQSLWLYDPFIEQATAYSLKDSIANTPIMLLTSDDDQLWAQYKVIKQSEIHFTLSSIDDNAQVQSLSIMFEPTSVNIKQFTITDATGQVSDIVLSKVDSKSKINTELFQFKVPEGVYLDDQR
ncbi:outer membrane lipoprotein chaperone LolA [Thalassotalea sp. 1_MG-2023]|uniref:outer membrane lipoprotein chaperone LolA n=1 Tax=Thalassotalea sp. 1_MG-2023 TaxID=3062680 RepID=UPI0026E33DEA|nr:outer membrane lipoprotein chaperone LolA [Thalassotalea sp. 1_MG-2023]MDO6428586.1 outer membrane lipoprotein chaperone LolA [Thalassotalea sp. 1_MG-2023]